MYNPLQGITNLTPASEITGTAPFHSIPPRNAVDDADATLAVLADVHMTSRNSPLWAM